MDISIYVTSDLTSSERRLSPEWTINQLKHKLEVITGVPPDNQKLVLYASSTSKESGTELNNDHAQLKDYSPVAFSRLHVFDTRPAEEQLDLENGPTEAFKLSDDQYDRREDSVRAWKRKNQLGRFDTCASEADVQASHQAVSERNIVVGARCRVSGEKLGLVKFIGAVKEISDSGRLWVGVDYDEPLGKHNGKGYFEAKPNHGAFVKPELVEIGEFEEEDYEL